MTFEIIDNFISEESQQYIQRMFESDQFCWRCVDTLNYDPGVQENSKLFNRKMFSSRLWYGDGYMDEVVKQIKLKCNGEAFDGGESCREEKCEQMYGSEEKKLDMCMRRI